MGSYSIFKVKTRYGDFEIDYYKNQCNPYLITLFRERDKKKYYDQNGEFAIGYKYSISISTLKNRLEILGFTLDESKLDFERNKARVLDDLYLLLDSEETILVRNTLSFEKWLNGLRNIVQFYPEYVLLEEEDNWTVNLLYEKYIFRSCPQSEYLDDYENKILGFHYSDIRYAIRAIVEVFPDNNEVMIDYSDLVYGGWVEPKDNLCEEALNEIARDYIVNERIIILAEGSSDINIIKKTMEIRYPQYIDFYAFMDFKTFKTQGSASYLVKYVKAFISSGLRNKIIALFDNDLAAEESLKELDIRKLPKNIRILKYPYLEFAEHYPTIDESGKVIERNINGVACSIELYLGKDILFDAKTNRCSPVSSQGKLQDKNKIQKKYLNFLRKCSNNEDGCTEHDWSGMDLIIKSIFNAFK